MKKRCDNLKKTKDNCLPTNKNDKQSSLISFIEKVNTNLKL